MLILATEKNYLTAQLQTLTPLSAGQAIQLNGGSNVTSALAALAATPAVGPIPDGIAASLLPGMHFISTPSGGVSDAGGALLATPPVTSNPTNTLAQILSSAPAISTTTGASGGQSLFPPSGVPGYVPTNAPLSSDYPGLETATTVPGQAGAAAYVSIANYLPHPSGPLTPGPLFGTDSAPLATPSPLISGS